MSDTFPALVDDLLVRGGITVFRLLPEDMWNIVATGDGFGLDFDDAYQYVTAERYGLTLVSLDGHFDQIERGRRTPMDIPGKTH